MLEWLGSAFGSMFTGAEDFGSSLYHGIFGGEATGEADAIKNGATSLAGAVGGGPVAPGGTAQAKASMGGGSRGNKLGKTMSNNLMSGVAQALKAGGGFRSPAASSAGGIKAHSSPFHYTSNANPTQLLEKTFDEMKAPNGGQSAFNSLKNMF